MTTPPPPPGSGGHEPQPPHEPTGDGPPPPPPPPGPPHEPYGTPAGPPPPPGSPSEPYGTPAGPPPPSGVPSYGSGQPPMTPPPAPGSGGPGDNNAKILSISSLVVSIIGLCSCMCFVGSIAALVLGILGKKSADASGDDQSRVMSLIGVALAGLGILVGIGYWIWFAVVAAGTGYYPTY